MADWLIDVLNYFDFLLEYKFVLNQISRTGSYMETIVNFSSDAFFLTLGFDRGDVTTDVEPAWIDHNKIIYTDTYSLDGIIGFLKNDTSYWFPSSPATREFQLETISRALKDNYHDVEKVFSRNDYPTIKPKFDIYFNQRLEKFH